MPLSKKAWEWLRKYYPEPAESISDLTQAVRHAARKFEGLRPEVLREHGLVLQRRGVCVTERVPAPSAPILEIDSSTCALCLLSTPEDSMSADCSRCPLAQARPGATPCDESTPNEESSPYGLAVYGLNPQPMLDALHAAEQLLLSRETQDVDAPVAPNTTS